MTETIRAHEASIEEVRGQIFTLRQNIGIAEEKIRYRSESARTFEEWYKTWQDSIAELEASIAAQSDEVSRLADETDEHENIRERLDDEKKELNTRLAKEKEQIQSLKAQALTYDKEYHSIQSRHAVLSGMQKEYEGFSRAGKEILSQKAVWKDSVFGAVAELIQMDTEVVAAIETALGAGLQNIVVDTETTAKEIIEYLKHHRLGRATFLPLTGLQVYPPRPQEKDAARESGAVGIASELVRCESQYRRVVEFLLNRTVIVKTMDDAIRIARKYGFKVRLITLDGDIINSGGSMTGGSRMRKEAGFLSRSLELTELKNRLESIAMKRAANETALQESVARYESLRKKQAEQTEADIKWQYRANELRMQLEKAWFTESQLIENMDERKRDGEQRIALHEEGRATNKQVNADIAQWQADAEKQEAVLTKMTAKREKLQSQQAVLEERSMKCQVKLTSRHERIQFLHREQARLDSEAVKNDQRMQEIGIELDNLQKIDEAQSVEKENCIAKQKEKQDELIALTAQKDEYQKQRFTILGELQSHEQTEKHYRKQASELNDKLHRIEMQYAKHQYECARNQEELDILGIASFEELAEKVGCYELRDEIELLPMLRKLERAIQALGLVNPNAVEEYRELAERYEFLEKQQADLIEAKNYLTDVIEQIDRVMEKNFTKAFHEIDEHFRTIFARIFGGGQARLELTDRGEMLTTGIEIIAQPPGKKQQNMVLLSGGERALTVIALLFAFLQYRPMPFTVVDEIDAPLDEANLERFVSFLKEFAKETQFIIITHRKVTMRAADVMHGVTNEDAGVSRVISVKMQEAE